MLKKSTLVLIIAFALFLGCKKNEQSQPEVFFINETGLVSKDTSVALGTPIRIGISAIGNNANITYLNVSVDDGVAKTALDSGFNVSEFKYYKTIIKNNNPSEKWTFTVMDKNRNKSSISVVLYKKPTINYGQILTYNDELLGAQENTTNGSFLSFANGHVLFYDSAVFIQNNIDLIYYYGQYQSTLSSPNENEAPLYFSGITSWQIKNETKYFITSLTETDFNKANNDSLLMTSYDDINAKKKAKYLSPGMIVSFINHQGKLGLVKVNNVSSSSTGSVNLSVKIQK